MVKKPFLIEASIIYGRINGGKVESKSQPKFLECPTHVHNQANLRVAN